MIPEELRRYTISIDIEVRPQDDFQHFQPNTVTARAPQLGVEWVSGNDAEALDGFFRFFVNWSHVKDSDDALKGVREIVRRAMDRLKVDWMEAAEIEHRRALELEAQNAAMRELVQEIANYPEYRDEDGWLTVLRAKSQGILAESKRIAE